MSGLLKNFTVKIPEKACVDHKTGYVLLNTEYYRRNGHSDHKKLRIGKAVSPDPSKWRENRLMYPNDNYFIERNEKPPLQPIDRRDFMFIGIYAVIKKLAKESGLLKILYQVFGDEDAALILDLAMYMIAGKESAFQDFPIWARTHATFSSKIRGKSYISRFGQELSYGTIENFKYLWAQHSIGRGKVFLCYDSTNINSQAEDATLVEYGHAKDNSKLPQVNAEYVIRQEDCIPVAYSEFPGSVTDMVEAPSMIEFLKEVVEEDKSIKLKIVVIADRGYTSEDNVKNFDNAGLDCIVMLKKNFTAYKKLVSAYAEKLRNNIEYYLPSCNKFATRHTTGWLNRTRYFHVIWDHERDVDARTALLKEIHKQEEELEKIVNERIRISKYEVKKYKTYFDLDADQDGVIKSKKPDEKDKVGYRVSKVTRKSSVINKAMRECAFRVIMSSCEMKPQEAIEAYSKRDTIEKVFRTLKDRLDMGSIRVHSNEAIRSKMLIWFVAVILYLLLFNKTEKLRKTAKDKSDYDVSTMLAIIHDIIGLKYNTKNYKLHGVIEGKQMEILKALEISEEEIKNEFELF